ncbi:MAG: ester cyclase [Flavobacteriaceae bacterium]|nr:ester cyclase [Flavobacteriaceae bacterium]
MYTRVWDDIVNNRNIDEINETNFDLNVVLVTSPENIVGIEDFKNYYQNYLTGFSDITFTIKDVFGQGDKIVKHWNFKGKNTGEFFGMPATGRAVDIDGVTLVKMKDGKIAQEQDFMDSTVFMQQLGIVSDPANVNVIDSAYKSFAKGDIPAVLGVMDPDIVWNEAESNVYADGNPYIGPDAVLKGVFERIGKDYESFMLDSIQLHDMSNNQVLATLRYKAKLKKNGASYNAQVAHLWTLQDGKVIGFQQFVDTKKLADALKK